MQRQSCLGNICFSVDWAGWQGKREHMHIVTVGAWCAETMGTQWLHEKLLSLWTVTGSSSIHSQCSKEGLCRSGVLFTWWHGTHWGLTPGH